MNLFVGVLGFCLIVQKVSGHAALIEPPARNVLWRTGFKNMPFHPDDDYLICEERGRQGCPPCGDDMNAPAPRPHEAGGTWATGIIVRGYHIGQVIDVFVNVSKSHGGFVDFKLCPLNEITRPVTQRCLDQNPLQIVGQSTSKVKIRAPYDGVEEIKVKVKLPTGLRCSHCVLQMNHITEQFLPRKVMFRNCADIAIE